MCDPDSKPAFKVRAYKFLSAPAYLYQGMVVSFLGGTFYFNKENRITTQSNGGEFFYKTFIFLTIPAMVWMWCVGKIVNIEVQFRFDD